MDRLGDALSNMSMYDVKAYVRKAQNAVLNFSEMEAKVREATNNEPWGTSTTTMQEIAEATQSYQQFHEIMPFIYRRFTEKSANEWRQIYKALQLLEYLVKNGSERVVDYARSHTAVIDMLRHFHYVDKNGKDQGVNIRNRAEELLELLSNVDKIRAERKRSRALNAKTGVGSGRTMATASSATFGASGARPSSSGRYGGFGSSSGGELSFGGGGYAQRVYGDGGGFDGSNYSGPGIGGDEFEEYEAGDRRGTRSSGTPAADSPAATATVTEANFISFDEPDAAPSHSTLANGATNGAGAGAADNDDDDDFDDFQSAPSATGTSNTGTGAPARSNILDLFAQSSGTPATAPAQSKLGYGQNQGSLDLLGSMSSSAAVQTPAPTSGTLGATKAGSMTGSAAPRGAGPKSDAFSLLWETSKVTGSTSSASTPKASTGSVFEPAKPTKPAAPAAPAAGTGGSSKNATTDDLLLF